MRDGQCALKCVRAAKGVLECKPENADELVDVVNATVTEAGSANDGKEKGFEPTSIELVKLDIVRPGRTDPEFVLYCGGR